MGFILGKHSRRELVGVHPDLVKVVERAIEITTQDFTVFDGLRTIEEQREYVARGVSQTLKSKHLPQLDSFGHAVDLVPYINGKVRWELEACYSIASAVQQAAAEQSCKIRWGGAWVVFGQHDLSPEQLVERYVRDRRKQGRKAFIDGPHYELAPAYA